MSSVPYLIYQKIKSVFKMANVVESDDSTDLRNGWFSYEGKSADRPQKGTLFTPYGVMHNPPPGAIAMLFAQNGQESNSIGIADDPKGRTLKELAKGEVAVGNYLTGSFVYFKENGDVFVNCDNNVQVIADGNITATCGGNVDVTSGGDISATASGAIDLEASTMTMTIGAATFEFTGTGLEVTGGDIVADGISLKTHVHGGVETGGSNTGTPV